MNGNNVLWHRKLLLYPVCYEMNEVTGHATGEVHAASTLVSVAFLFSKGNDEQ